ncbi:MAG TPA: SHOCT domain-containing protein [Nitrospinota bacterium]|nr:SHOCT domain-containing protein [Nitrospinota bacterium]
MKMFQSRLMTFCLSLLFIFSAFEPAHAQYREGYGIGPDMMHWGFGMMRWFGPLFMIVFLVLTIVVIIFLVRWITLTRKPELFSKEEESALDILKKRYAKGEINKQEFEEKKKDLL